MNKDDPKKMGIGLEKLVDHFDHICQLSGNCEHIGFGSDLDGLFGLEQTPFDMNTIADLQKFQFILKSRGYSDDDIENILKKNNIKCICTSKNDKLVLKLENLKLMEKSKDILSKYLNINRNYIIAELKEQKSLKTL